MIKTFQGNTPQVEHGGWIAENAMVIGNVTLEQDVSIWFHAVLRGDCDEIRIKAGSNIQDGCILHTDPKHQLIVEERVSVGHGCILHGCHIESECLIGMGAVILNGARIGKHSIVGAGAVVIENMVVPQGSLVVGCPAKIIKQTSVQQIQEILHNAKHYIELSQMYQKEESEWTPTLKK